jgi:hypothetical protein
MDTYINEDTFNCSTLSLREAEVALLFVEIIAEGLAEVSLEVEPIFGVGSTVLFLSFVLELDLESSRGLFGPDVSLVSCSQSLERDRRYA